MFAKGNKMDKFNSVAYKRSRTAYMIQCTVEYFVTLLVTDAFLAKLLTYIGISDALIGVISSFISLAFVIQLASIALLKNKVSTKKVVILFDTLSNFFFMFLYFVPFLPVGKELKTGIVVLCVLMAYSSKYLIYSICFKWANSFVHPTKRGEYSAVKEIISLVSGMIFTVVAGNIIDRYEGIGNIEGGFLFVAAAILIFNIANLVCLSMINEEEADEEGEQQVAFKEVLENTIGNRAFRKIVILQVLYDISRYFTIGFIGVFKTNELLMSVGLIQIVNVIANIVRISISVPLGKYSSKNSYVKGFKLGLYIFALGFLINIFTTRSTWWLIIIYTILYNASVAGTNMNSFNITYNYVDVKYVSQAMAIKNSIGGLAGFAASIAGSRVLAAVQNNGNQFLGLHIYGQQLLSLISFVITVATIIFIKSVIEKEAVKSQ